MNYQQINLSKHCGGPVKKIIGRNLSDRIWDEWPTDNTEMAVVTVWANLLLLFCLRPRTRPDRA